MIAEWRLQDFVLPAHRGSRGGAYDGVTVTGDNKSGVLPFQKRAQIAPLVIKRAIIKIRPLAKDGDAQASQIIDGGVPCLAIAQSLYSQVAHAAASSLLTWAIQSARL